ncbi:putative type IX secretion system sortase PorU2 [Fulvivirga sediminis]|uniref:Transporter n=1 Tax=Fulvivirga sediminis TaxID=2803949 RepID=A0A937JZG8_9BACT|nr:C25 family cysteine peptidase [Fulvivirga sediminis]MBL3655270.1 transporter [Fulvivirga sediminis]
MRSRVIIIALVGVITALSGQAQEYGNEWIDYSKQYYKIPVAREGMYRITYADLESAGFPVVAVDPRRIQIFHRGVEQAINIPGQGDSRFDPGDYIEFYGQKNDGTMDRKLYKPENAQPHSFYNIYSDTTVYYLTYNIIPPLAGKRMDSFKENNINGLPAQTAHNETVLSLMTNQYSAGRSFNVGDYTTYSYFDYGEGWTGRMIQEGQQLDYTISGISNAVRTAENPQLEVLLMGRDNVNHLVEVLVGQNTASLRSLGTATWSDYTAHTFRSTISWSDISASGNLSVRIRDLGVSGGNDRISTSYLNLVYSQNFNLGGANSKKIYLKSESGNRSYVEMTNVPASPSIYDITDSDNVRKIGFNSSGSSLNTIVNNTALDRQLWVNGNDYLTPVLTKIEFTNIDASAYDYIIISNKHLRKEVDGTLDPVEAYAEYRRSIEGGSYKPLLVNMDQLYNQFNYGEKSSLSIYQFMRYLVENGSPRYLFLIGKGLDPSVNFFRNTNGFYSVTKLGVTYQIRDLVPSAGNPGSDVLFTAGLDGTTYEPAVPVGRLPAVNAQQVLNYLNKVKEAESLPFDALWRKKLLHLSGGASASQLTIFRRYTDSFAAVAEQDYLGGDVKTISKERSSTVELINVADEVNDGLNLITFFGHSAPSVTDIDIGFATDPVLGYDNPGKYPMFLINGCNAGQFFNVNVLFGEDWILADNRGAIGFAASTSYGFADRLRKYSDTFYQTAYGDSLFIHKPIGDVMKEVVARYMNSTAANPTNITQAQQMVYLGDPVLTLFGADKSDFETNDDNVYVEPFNEEPVSAQVDSFALKIIVRNFGVTINDSLRVHVSRSFSDNTTAEYDSVYASVHFQDTLVMIINNEVNNAAGNNQFQIDIDYFNEIDELDETNNSATLNLYIPLFGTKNLYPINYAIVNSQPVELLVQASDLLSGRRDYIVEIDTTNTFNSPFKKQQTVQAKLLASWKTDLLPNVPANDSVVYYWRSKFAMPEEGESTEWVNSSFTYINNGPNGWSQREYPQLENNLLSGLELNDGGQRIDFKTNTLDVFVRTFGSSNGSGIADVSLILNGIEYIINNGYYCRNNTVSLVAFDRNTTLPYLGVTTNRGCGRQPQVINNFTFNELDIADDGLMEYIDNVNVGDSVVMFSIGNPRFESWSPAVRSKLEQIGASAASLATLQNGEPVILIGKKGSPAGSATMLRASTTPRNEAQLFTNLTITGIFSSGNMTSTAVGPASNWQTLVAYAESDEIPVTDNNYLEVWGVTSSGDEVMLKGNLPMGSTDLSDIDATQYPQLRVKLYSEDNDNLTAAQLVKWEVYYTGVPEGILLIPDEAAKDKELSEGEVFEADYAFKNISSYTFPDSISIEYSLFNNSTRTSVKYNKKVHAPQPGDTSQFSISMPTLGRAGENDYNLFVNRYQVPEQYYDNNIFDKSNYLKVKADNINPLIDVAFDGQYILDGDIVAPSPLISIRLKDENQFIFKNDTSNINVFLRKPCETCVFTRVPFSSGEVHWFPADESNEFRIEYKPESLADGVYTLRVDAEDASGNSSGTEPYQVNFEVVNESAITNFYPYPNPFSSSTRFVFTLTGSEIPDQIKIQIMTVSGKVVREIFQDELGPIHIGNNISDFAWDGRDEFGDQLANGVYLYRVIVRQNGQGMDHRETSADKAFKHGFGKLYILR